MRISLRRTKSAPVSLEKRGPFPYEVRAALAAYGPPVRSTGLADYVALHTPVKARYRTAAHYRTARPTGQVLLPGETVSLAQLRERMRAQLRRDLGDARWSLGLPNIHIAA